MSALSKMLNGAIIIDNRIVKVDQFLNHQLDIELFAEIGERFYDYFKHKPITKIVTCEASGIAVAMVCGLKFGCDVVFAKKSESLITSSESYTERVYSYTKQKESIFRVDKRFITQKDHVLLVDDFLANGEAMMGLISICQQAQASVEGIGIVIEKGFQSGGKILREKGYDLNSLVIIDKIEENKLILRK